MGKLKKLWKDRDNQYRYFKWLMQYTKPYAGKITFMMIVNLATTLISLWMVTISKRIIDNASGGNPFLNLVFVYIGLMFFMEAISIISRLVSTMLNEHFSFGIRKQVYEKIIHSCWIDVKRYHTGDLMTRLTSDAGNIADGIINTIPSIIQLGIELVLVFFTLFFYSKELALFALVLAPVAALSSWLLGKKLKVLQVKVQESESAYRSFMQESMANLLVVKAFANEGFYVDKLTRLREERFHWVYKRTKMGIASTTVMGVTFQIGYVVAFAFGAVQISKNVITYGTLSVFLALVNRVQAPVISLAQQIPKVVSVLASAGRVMEIQNLPMEVVEDTHIEGDKIGVKLNNVTFGYLPEETVLENVSLEIQPGEFAAIIGESGIGKTTLIRIIMSFMSNVQGDIRFYNEKNETEVANAGTRNFISYVPQGNTLFSGTVRENIQIGDLKATEQELWDALILASGDEFVKELPEGLDTVIGERGHGLSEGQAQRIAIARAFVRKSPVLILDEATSALDEQTEQKVIKGLQNLTPRPTCLIITHRKSILEYCDREIKIESKKVEEI